MKKKGEKKEMDESFGFVWFTRYFMQIYALFVNIWL